jgi:hypothetical protein
MKARLQEMTSSHDERYRLDVCVCVCVCERERERERVDETLTGETCTRIQVTSLLQKLQKRKRTRK